MNTDRRQKALQVRNDAAKLAESRPHPDHVANSDEQKFRNADGQPSYLVSYTKGLPHCHKLGVVQKPEDFQKFVRAIDSGDPRDFQDTPLGPQGHECECDSATWKSDKVNKLPKGGKPEAGNKAKAGEKGGRARVRAWESQGAGNTFDLEGPDAQAVTMPPAPELGSDELTAEMAEVYVQALLRDVPFSLIKSDVTAAELKKAGVKHVSSTEIKKLLNAINDCAWFNKADCCDLSDAQKSRMRSEFKASEFFRGQTPGDKDGPYLSQFLLIGNSGINGNDDVSSGLTPAEGQISYGSIRIDQRVRVAKPCEDHMTKWNEWFDVQNGADLRGQENYENKAYRFITTPRDLATYVHYDALYEAYLNACLIMLGNGTKFDPGIPFQGEDRLDHQQGFAHFGGPHILSLVTEVATRALKAVRFQKFNVHRRMRPEVLAARLTKHKDLASQTSTLTEMTKSKGLKEILDCVKKNNPKDRNAGASNYLLPMPFCEGSPMHPAYGAGHATVAGACVTILKAFFDHKSLIGNAYEATPNGSCLTPVKLAKPLTVEGELNKLASNISIGRNWAGVHYYTDYIESIRVGEQIALGILEEQKLTYGENFSMTVPLFDGGTVRI